MKFIGQFIQNLIARFRNDVYLEDISSGTIDSGGNLGLDSNNKIVKANVPAEHDAVTLAGSLDYITLSGQEITRNAIDLAQDVTGTLAVSKGGTGLSSISTLLNSNVTSVSGNAGTATALETARTIAGVSFNGTANISLNNSSITNGAGYTTNTGDITDVNFRTDDGNNVGGSSGALSLFVSGGEGIDTSASSGTTIIISGEEATSGNKGIVQLATTGEADTGTNTTKVITPAGLKSHVDARYSYQYISFSFSTTLVADSWHTPSQHGIDNHTWSNTHKVGGTQVASDNPPDVDSETTISIDYLDMPSCITIPKACKLVGFYGQSRLHSLSTTNARPVFGLFRAAEPSDRSNADVTATVVAFDSYDTTPHTDPSSGASNNMQNRFLKLNADVDVDLAAGDLIYPAFGVDLTSVTGSGFGSFTVVLKTLIP